jgi:hypothetical protein
LIPLITLKALESLIALITLRTLESLVALETLESLWALRSKWYTYKLVTNPFKKFARRRRPEFNRGDLELPIHIF